MRDKKKNRGSILRENEKIRSKYLRDKKKKRAIRTIVPMSFIIVIGIVIVFQRKNEFLTAYLISLVLGVLVGILLLAKPEFRKLEEPFLAKIVFLTGICFAAVGFPFILITWIFSLSTALYLYLGLIGSVLVISLTYLYKSQGFGRSTTHHWVYKTSGQRAGSATDRDVHEYSHGKGSWRKEVWLRRILLQVVGFILLLLLAFLVIKITAFLVGIILVFGVFWIVGKGDRPNLI